MISLAGTDFFAGRRAPLVARDAAIATSHPLATAAGLDILAAGGNAVDAALAAVSVQCVVEPHMTGIGGDCFVLYAPKGGATVALNGSGRAPAAADVGRLRSLGLGCEIPQTSPHAVTVPGAVSAWTRLHADHGSLPLDRLFRRAVDYARNGYPVSPRVAEDWAVAADFLRKDEGDARGIPTGWGTARRRRAPCPAASRRPAGGHRAGGRLGLLRGRNGGLARALPARARRAAHGGGLRRGAGCGVLYDAHLPPRRMG